ncbi:MAG: mannose-1-phosphate guanylyltransferase, partial [Candidatus Omnitrophica bacterium]|nr:mannose-1-phosphate guanylyltransferase [Candidatus Omnitrophota bacterium]
MVYVLILAGGKGERFWPLSRRSLPKQFVSLGEGVSLLQETFKRALTITSPERIYAITNKNQFVIIRKQLPRLKKENIIIEPEFKNTASCIGLASIILRDIDPDALMVVMPSDHIINPASKFKALVKKAIGVANKTGYLILVGIKPTYPATGFGYLRFSRTVKEGVYNVNNFFEKPTLRKAKAFLRNKNFAWNSGVFVWKAKSILDDIKRYMPKLYNGLEEISLHLNDNADKFIKKNYKNFENISVDKGVLERSDRIKALVSDFFWCDVGSWRALEYILPKDRFGNIVRGNFIGVDTGGCIIFCKDDHLFATVGLNNLVIVKAGNATLVCPKERLDEV